MTADYKTLLAQAAALSLATRPYITAPPEIESSPQQAGTSANTSFTQKEYKAYLAQAANQFLDQIIIAVKMSAVDRSWFEAQSPMIVGAHVTWADPSLNKRPGRPGTPTVRNAKPTAPSATPLEKKKIPLTVRQADHACLDFVKSSNVQRLLRKAARGHDFPKAVHKATVSARGLQTFRSICVCDPKMTGQPIQLKSRHFSIGPRGLKVGACEFINLPLERQHYRDPLLMLSPRPGPDGRPAFVLEYAASLISEELGQPTYVLACAVDVTDFVRKLTYMTVAAEEAEVKDAHARHIVLERRESAIYIDNSRTHSTVSLSHTDPYKYGPKLQVAQAPLMGLPEEPDSPIDWLKLDAILEAPRVEAPLPMAVQHSMDTLLHDVSKQYHDSFILSLSASLSGRSSFSGVANWQISFTSAAIHARSADLRVALSRNDAKALRTLGSMLAGGQEIEMGVRWGASAMTKSLRAVPMVRDYGKGVCCWLCFLVDVVRI